MPHKRKHSSKLAPEERGGSVGGSARTARSSLRHSAGVGGGPGSPSRSAELHRSSLVDSLLDRLSRLAMIPDPIAANLLPKKRNKSMKAAPIVDVHIEFDEVGDLCEMAIDSFARQSSLLHIPADALPITVCADLHGQFRDLLAIIGTCGSPHDHSYLFLGDYVDRGVQGIETFLLLLCLKVKYPKTVYLLRGNHEDFHTSQIYGFYDECLSRFTFDGEGEKIWFYFVNVFNMMPVAALIEKRILCVHGGISPTLSSLSNIQEIRRPTVVPPCGILCDLLWSDPDASRPGWSLSPRGIGFTFGEGILRKFCEDHKIDLVVRGHQIGPEMFRTGYKFFANSRLVSIFSAPNYLNMRNNSCVLQVSKQLRCHFVIFRPTVSGRSHQTRSPGKSSKRSSSV